MLAKMQVVESKAISSFTKPRTWNSKMPQTDDSCCPMEASAAAVEVCGNSGR